MKKDGEGIEEVDRRQTERGEGKMRMEGEGKCGGGGKMWRG